MNTNTEYHQLSILDGLELFSTQSHKLDFPFHTHDTYNFALILENTFNIELSDKLLKVPSGSISIVHPDEVHATPCDKELGHSFFTFYVSPEFIKSLNKNQEAYFEQKVINDLKLFQEMYMLAQNVNAINFEIRLTTALKELVLKYALKKEFNETTTHLFKTFINEASFQNFSLEKTATQFGLNKYKFMRLFKQETGLTPNNYVLLKRIEKSKELLKNGVPIFDAAIDSGFYDSSHFYRNFKRFTGVTPLVFQNSYFVI